MSTLSVSILKSKTALTPPVVQDLNGVGIGTFCRAWVNFNGTGTVAIRAAFNVTSITDVGVGIYQVNFTNAMLDINYSVVSIGGDAVSGGNGGSILSAIQNSTGNTILDIRNTAGTLSDRAVVCVSVFR